MAYNNVNKRNATYVTSNATVLLRTLRPNLMDRRARTALKSPIPNIVIVESIVESLYVVKEANSSKILM